MRRRECCVREVSVVGATLGGAGRHVSAASKSSVSGIGFVRCCRVCREGVPCVVRVGPVLFVWTRLCLVVAATLT